MSLEKTGLKSRETSTTEFELCFIAVDSEFSIQMSLTLSKYHDLSHAMIPHFGSVFHQLYHPNSTISIVTNSAIQILSILSCKYKVLHHLNITNFLDCADVKFMTKMFINNKKSQCIVSQGIVCWFLYYNPNLGLI